MNQPKICLDNVTLISLLNGSQETNREIDLHLRNCSSCRARLDDLSDSVALKTIRSQVDRQFQSFSFLSEPIRKGDLGTLDDHHIEAELGRGGLGIVFRGFDATLKRDVAVKVLNNDLSIQSDVRFRREAEAAAKVTGDYVVPIHGIGETRKDRRPYLVMPLISGGSLRERLVDPMTAQDAAEIIQQVALGLVNIHQENLVHRDVKPANVLLDAKDGRAKLTDFGLARGIEDATLTQTSMLCGTPEYMSPEQVNGEKELTFATDIYGLGITFYECLTGTTPFRGNPLQVLNQHLVSEPVAPSRLNPVVPTDLENICLKAIAKESVNRYPTAQAFADDVGRFLNGMPVQAKPISTFARLRKWSKRNRVLATSLLLLMLSLIAGTAISTTLCVQESGQRRQTA